MREYEPDERVARGRMFPAIARQNEARRLLGHRIREDLAVRKQPLRLNGGEQLSEQRLGRLRVGALRASRYARGQQQYCEQDRRRSA